MPEQDPNRTSGPDLLAAAATRPYFAWHPGDSEAAGEWAIVKPYNRELVRSRLPENLRSPSMEASALVNPFVPQFL